MLKLGQRCAVDAEDNFLCVVYGIRKLKLAGPEGSCGDCTPPPLMEPMVVLETHIRWTASHWNVRRHLSCCALHAFGVVSLVRE